MAKKSNSLSCKRESSVLKGKKIGKLGLLYRSVLLLTTILTTTALVPDSFPTVLPNEDQTPAIKASYNILFNCFTSVYNNNCAVEVVTVCIFVSFFY